MNDLVFEYDTIIHKCNAPYFTCIDFVRSRAQFCIQLRGIANAPDQLIDLLNLMAKEPIRTAWSPLLPRLVELEP
jgi:hypothetical protein